MERIKKFLFTNTSTKQTLTKNVVWLFIGEVGTRLLKLAAFAFAARTLGVSEWGIFSYGLALIGIFSIFTDIGINTILLREISKSKESVQKYISTGFFIKLGLSIVGSIILFISALFLNNSDIQILIPLLIGMLFIDSIREYGFSLNRTFELMEKEALIKIASNTLLVILCFVILNLYPSAYALLYVYLAAGIFSIILLLGTLKLYLKNIFSNFDSSLVTYIISEAWPIGIVAVLGTILASIDTLLLGILTDTTQVGYYAAAQKPLQFFSLVPILIATALLPLLSRNATGENTEVFKKILSRAMLASVAIVIPLLAFCVIFSNTIITVLFGIEYIPASPILQITSISVLAIIPNVFLSNALIMHGKQKLIIRLILVGAISNILLSVLLIPYLGMYGAAIAYTLSQISSNIFIIMQTRKFPALHFTFNMSDIKQSFQMLKDYTSRTKA